MQLARLLRTYHTQRRVLLSRAQHFTPTGKPNDTTNQNTKMPLTWDVSKIKDQSTVCFDGDFKINPITKALIFMTESIGVPVITEESQYDFFLRCRVHERINGAAIPDSDPLKLGNKSIGLGDVRNHIGLRTNARRLSGKGFREEIMNSITMEALRDQQTEVTLLCSESKMLAETPVVP